MHSSFRYTSQLVKRTQTHLFVSKTRVLILLLFFTLTFLYLWTTPNFNESGTVKIWDKNGILLYESAGNFGSKQFVSYEKLPKSLVNSVIVAEDVSFLDNWGVDISAIIRSSLLNIQQRRIVSGASTITQQLARTTFYGPDELPRRDVVRKMREILTALRITITYSKEEILEKYLNTIYFGNLAYGAQSASNIYFGKDVSQLSLAESAMLAGLISSPVSRNPFANFEQSKKRQEEILNTLVARGFVSQEEAGIAKREKLHLNHSQSMIKAPHFVQYVLSVLDKLNVSKNTGINVYTTLDYPVYTLSEGIAKRWVENLKEEHDLSNTAIVLLKNETGEIVNMLGGVDYFDHYKSGQVNMATALRQPGSALKPVTYASAFEKGFTPASLIFDVKKVYLTKKGEGFSPNNYDGLFHGLVLVREALASSYNLPVVEMLNQIGLPSFLRVAKNLGITSFTEDSKYDLAITLGGAEVSLLDLTNVYSSFARGGNYLKPFAISRVENDTGKTLYVHHNEAPKQAFKQNGPQISYLITSILSDPKARIPGFHEKNPLVLSQPAAAKTGTTTDWHDNWTVGYTPSYTVGVWVGNNDNHAMKNITGITGAAPIWNQFFEEFLKDKQPEFFVKPQNIITKTICKQTGQLPEDGCDEVYEEEFIKGTEPTKASGWYKKVKIDSRNGLLATDTCPASDILEKTFFDYPQETFTWAKQNGKELIPTVYSPLCNSNAMEHSETSSLVEITNPVSGAIFEDAPQLVDIQALVFEAKVSSDVKELLWFVDEENIGDSTSFPFNTSWRLVTGKHTVVAKGKTKSGKLIKSEPVNFTVLQYKEGQ